MPRKPTNKPELKKTEWIITRITGTPAKYVDRVVAPGA